MLWSNLVFVSLLLVHILFYKVAHNFLNDKSTSLSMAFLSYQLPISWLTSKCSSILWVGTTRPCYCVERDNKLNWPSIWIWLDSHFPKLGRPMLGIDTQMRQVVIGPHHHQTSFYQSALQIQTDRQILCPWPSTPSPPSTWWRSVAIVERREFWQKAIIMKNIAIVM